MFDTYRNKLSQSLLNKLFIMAAIAVLISLIVSLWFSKYLTEPLKILEDRVGKIAKQDCYEPLNLDRQDEVGSLAKSIEDMRIQLVQRDKEQQNMLQQVSHELKTPIMVIRSYAQAVYDGIYPKGNLKGSIQVIDEEAERLENKVKDLLYLSKLQYIRKKKIAVEEFNIYKLILEIVDKFKVNNSHIQWEIKGEDIFIKGDREQWRVVFENILDNATRYAKSTIKLEMKIEENLKLKIYNDGEKINKEEMNNLFKPFNKGNNGKYGLGLSIVKEIVEIHKGEIFVNNKEEGVEFCINISN
ncbi:sensor histidine kinase [Clostridium cochlearium]|uniref:sensor histidine kinase n=1 Tax=Clostridium cochlearium TaxID=1494 RepID=UPI001C0EB044|nr:HAMP domain-containing sensor histidine kinase [Clostridium cochlearium]MBU5270279.1 HAMP domain-containing histidine kinase [Clostridium cochlearium]